MTISRREFVKTAGAAAAGAALLPPGGHHGGDPILLDTIFADAPRPDHPKLPGSRAGALSCLTGIAARRSCEERRPVRISELVQLT